jgi:HEAT repeat protein
MGFFWQLLDYGRALAFETFTGLILVADAVGLIALVAVPHLEDKLATRTWAVVVAVAGYAVGNFQLYRRRDPLLPAGAAAIELNSLDPEARRVGIEALFELSIDRRGGLARTLLRRAALRHQWADVRRQATLSIGLVALHRRGERAIGQRRLWSSPGLRQLSRLRTYASEPTVIRALGGLLTDLRRTNSVEDRIRAAEILGQIPGRLSLQYLMAAARGRLVGRPEDADDERPVRQAAIVALGRKGERAVVFLASMTEDEEIGGSAIKSLGSIPGPVGDPRSPGVAELLGRYARGQEDLRDSLLWLDDSAASLKPFLDDPGLGKKCAYLLGQIVSATKRDDDTYVTADSIRVPARINHGRVAACVALETAIRAEAHPNRLDCAKALGMGAIGVAALVRLLPDRPEAALAGLASARPQAVEYVRRLPEVEAAIPLLLDALQDGSEETRANAAAALGSPRVVDAINDLVAAAADRDLAGAIRLAAVRGLGRMESEEAVPPLRRLALGSSAEPEILTAIRQALTRLYDGPDFWQGKGKVPAARQALDDLRDLWPDRRRQ